MKRNNPEEELLKAREYAFLLLEFRPRSRNELAQRLNKKKFEKEIVIKTLDFLEEKSFLDDASFSRVWIRSRLKRPFGFRRIEQELRQKGIDKSIIDREIASVKKDYSESDIVGTLAQEKLAKLKGIDPKKAKARVYAYLLRRGFSPETIIETING